MKKRAWIFLLAILILLIFFRFYQLEERAQFTWDQVDNAWQAKNIIINHRYPLLGMPVKQDTGIFIGPLYYYLIALFYWMFDLDPIASPIFAGVTSIITFFALFYVAKKLFSVQVALVTVFLNSISFYIIYADRIQWPVNFIPVVSMLIFYFLYNVLIGNAKYILALALVLGFSFHIHLTSMLYFIILLFCFPLFPRTKEFFKHVLLSTPLFLVWFIPIVIDQLTSKNQTNNLYEFIHNNYHGIHFRRILQLANDAFIETENPIVVPFLRQLKFIFLPLFIIVYYVIDRTRKKFIFCYLLLLWFLVPWFVFSVYKGDLSNYYFSQTRLLVVIMFAYLIVRAWQVKNMLVKVSIAALFIGFTFINVRQFFLYDTWGLANDKKKAYRSVKESRGNEFTHGSAQSYLYYYYERKFYGKE